MKENHIEVSKTARYYVLGEPSSQTKNIWICFHGFGQLGAIFSKKFEFMVDDETVLIVPEGLSKFYFLPNYDKIGASWITQEMKKAEAQDYLKYLNQVFERETSGLDLSKIAVNVLGFSQGCTTAARWVNQLSISPANFVIWAGFFSKGLGAVLAPKKLANSSNYYVYGDKDSFLKSVPEMGELMRKDLGEHFNAKIIRFKGPHKIDDKVLKELYASIKNSN